MSVKSKIQALITAANNTTGESDTTLTDAVQTLVDGYGQGGTTITNGVVWKTLDGNGNPTEVDFYGSVVPSYCFGFNGYGSANNPLNYAQKINWKTTVTTVRANAFVRSNLTSLVIPETATTVMYNSGGLASLSASLVSIDYLSPVDIDYLLCNWCIALKTVYAPNITRINNISSSNANGAFSGCTALEDVELGKVGTAVTSIHNTTFYNCTQSGLTITIYTTGSYVDSVVANTRNGATNATIIIKASEATTYGGNSYAAGDTILTSEVTA